ncbi:MAG TPA: hypothetical protein VED84_01065 [Acidimicrobiales bacterium]|nr:hypothetical protein [Acidimicrobiales bacterium]
MVRPSRRQRGGVSLAAGAALIVAAGVLSATSDASTASKINYLRVADAICARGVARENALGNRPFKLAELPSWLDKNAAIVRADLTALRKLTPPPGDAAEVGQIFSLLDDALAQVPTIDRAARAHHPQAVDKAFSAMLADYASADVQARAFGFTVCGASAAATTSAPLPDETIVTTPSSTLPAPADASLRHVTVFVQTDSAWSSVLADGQFASSGTVPTAVASLLTGFGLHATPATVATALTKSGAWNPTTGANWSAVSSYVASVVPPGHGAQSLEVSPVTLSAAAQALAPAYGAPAPALYLVAWTEPGTKTPTITDESAFVLVSYDPAADEFGVVDPTSGATTMQFFAVAQGNPWLVQVTEPVGSP